MGVRSAFLFVVLSCASCTEDSEEPSATASDASSSGGTRSGSGGRTAREPDAAQSGGEVSVEDAHAPIACAGLDEAACVYPACMPLDGVVTDGSDHGAHAGYVGCKTNTGILPGTSFTWAVSPDGTSCAWLPDTDVPDGWTAHYSPLPPVCVPVASVG